MNAEKENTDSNIIGNKNNPPSETISLNSNHNWSTSKNLLILNELKLPIEISKKKGNEIQMIQTNNSPVNIQHKSNKEEKEKQGNEPSQFYLKGKNTVCQNINNNINNIFSHPSEGDGQSDNNTYLQDNESTYIQCFTCEKWYNREKIFTFDPCLHSFCKKCLEYYLEDKIEKDDFNLKCPIFDCSAKIGKNQIKELVSNIHYNIYISNNPSKINPMINILDTNNEIKDDKYNIQDMMRDTIELRKKFEEKISNLENLAQKNVIEIGNNEGFYDIIKYVKSLICPKCKEKSLFTKSGIPFIKCLNLGCKYTICKYCFHEFNSMHLDLNYDKHCTVYFRISTEPKTAVFCRDFLFNILYLIASFLMVILGLFWYNYDLIEKILCVDIFNRNICQDILCWIFSLIVFLLELPFFIILIPYFPIFITMFG